MKTRASKLLHIIMKMTCDVAGLVWGTGQSKPINTWFSNTETHYMPQSIISVSHPLVWIKHEQMCDWKQQFYFPFSMKWTHLTICCHRAIQSELPLIVPKHCIPSQSHKRHRAVSLIATCQVYLAVVITIAWAISRQTWSSTEMCRCMHTS